jgi:hypothetical protein
MRVAYVAALLGLLTPSLVFGQSLAEAARQEKERRKKIQESTSSTSKVVSDEELQTNKGSVANDPQASSASTGTGSQSSQPATPAWDKARDEQAWRDRAARAEARLADAKQRYETLNGLTLTQGQYYVDKDGKKVIGSLEQLRQKIDQAKAEYDDAQRDRDAVFEGARRAGVPPGWLR